MPSVSCVPCPSQTFIRSNLLQPIVLWCEYPCGQFRDKETPRVQGSWFSAVSMYALRKTTAKAFFRVRGPLQPFGRAHSVGWERVTREKVTNSYLPSSWKKHVPWSRADGIHYPLSISFDWECHSIGQDLVCGRSCVLRTWHTVRAELSEYFFTPA